MKKFTFVAAVSFLVAGSAAAFDLAAPASAASAKSGIAPAAVQTAADVYDAVPAQTVIFTGTTCTITAPGGAPDCLENSGCPFGTDNCFARSLYLGSLFNPFGLGSIDYGVGDANDMTGFAVFNTDGKKLKDCSLRVNNLQRFPGGNYAFNLHVRQLHNTGSDGDYGVKHVFENRGPLVGLGGEAGDAFDWSSVNTALAEGRKTNGSACGSVARGQANRDTTAHAPICGGVEQTPAYVTVDRSIEIPLGDLVPEEDSYITWQYTNAATGELAGETVVENPVYLALYAEFGNSDASARLQDGDTDDNIVSLHGDCDFAGDETYAQNTNIELVCK